MKSKKGQITGAAIVYIIVGALIAYVLFSSGSLGNLFGGGTTTTTTTQTNTDGTPYISTGSTSVTLNGVNALQTGTAVTTSRKYSVNGGSFSAVGNGAISASPKEKLNILLNASGYHSAIVKDFEVPSAPTKEITVGLNGNASITMTMFNTNDQVINTNGSGAGVNQSVSAGGSYTLRLKLDGQDKKSTNDMRCIVSSTIGANTTSITMSGDLNPVAKGKGKPSWYTLYSADSAVYIFDIDAVTGAVTKNLYINIVSNSGKSLATGRLLVTCYTKENFVDDYNGLISYDVEDSLGNLQSIANNQFVVYLQ